MDETTQCTAITLKDTRCKRRCKPTDGLCTIHSSTASETLSKDERRKLQEDSMIKTIQITEQQQRWFEENKERINQKYKEMCEKEDDALLSKELYRIELEELHEVMELSLNDVTKKRKHSSTSNNLQSMIYDSRL